MLKIVKRLEDLPRRNRYVVTVGNFDGLHVGHRFLLRSLRRYSKIKGAKILIISFEGHTRIDPNASSWQLFTNEQKEEKLSELGVHYQWLVDFQLIKGWSYEDFLQKLTDTLQVSMIIASDKLKIGKDRQGDMDKIKQTLEKIKPEIEVVKLESREIDENVISSSLIRSCIEQGNVRQAALFLGEYFSVVGIVKKGNQMGRVIGFPTLNLYPPRSKALPKAGVYLTRVLLKGRSYEGLTFVGKPTLPKAQKSSDIHEYVVESFLLNFSSLGYNKKIRVEFLAFLRENEKVASVNDLRDLLLEDKKKAEAFFQSYSYLY